MTVLNDAFVIDEMPLQDADLLQRLNQYFSTLDQRLRHGQGWMIYNASGPRGTRLAKFIQDRLVEANVPFSHWYLPWRDFSLTSYLVQVELKSIEGQEAELPERARTEYAIATRISRQTLARLVTADLLILSGLVPRHAWELQYLDETIERRCRHRLATILLTPEQPHELAADVTRVTEDGGALWSRIAERLYKTSLIAV